MGEATANVLMEVAKEIISNAERERRDLTDFEAGRVDAFLDIAGAVRAVRGHEYGALWADANVRARTMTIGAGGLL